MAVRLELDRNRISFTHGRFEGNRCIRGDKFARGSEYSNTISQKIGFIKELDKIGQKFIYFDKIFGNLEKKKKGLTWVVRIIVRSLRYVVNVFHKARRLKGSTPEVHSSTKITKRNDGQGKDHITREMRGFTF